jgi:hypothetical protein
MKRDKGLETILVLVLAFTILYWRFQETYWLIIAVLLGIIGLFAPGIAVKIHWFWMKLGHILGYFVSKILLTVIFFVVLFPLGVLSKLAGKNALKLKAGAKSYFTERNHLYKKEDLENMW